MSVDGCLCEAVYIEPCYVQHPIYNDLEINTETDSCQNLSMEFVKYIHKICKRLFCHYMRVKCKTVIKSTISDDFYH